MKEQDPAWTADAKLVYSESQYLDVGVDVRRGPKELKNAVK